MKFFQNIILVMICFVVLIGFGLSNNAYAQCKIKATTTGFVNEVGPYDSCDKGIKHTFHFTVVSNNGQEEAICYISGAGIWDQGETIFDAEDFEYGEHTITWTNEATDTQGHDPLKGKYIRDDCTYTVEYYSQQQQ